MSNSEIIDVDEKMVRGALQSVVSDQSFTGAKRLRDFLTYIVEEFIAGRGEQISGKTIAQDVYERQDSESGDPENVVRVDARRLRQSLALYYETDGKEDPVRIYLDTGAYLPRFEYGETAKGRSSVRFGEKFLIPMATLFLGMLIGIGGYSVLILNGPKSTETPEKTPSGLDADPRRAAIMQKSPRALQAVNFAEQGRAMMAPMFDRRRQEIITDVFLHAVDLDDAHFGGYAGAAQALGFLTLTTPPGATRDALLSQARKHAQQAERLGPAEGWTQSALGWVALADGDGVSAYQFSLRAIELSPDDGYVVDHHGLIALWTGVFDDALAVASRPASHGGKFDRYMNRNVIGASNFHLGNFGESVKSFEQVGYFGDPLSPPTLAYYAAALVGLGRMEEARDKALELKHAWPKADVDALLKGVHSDEKNALAVLEPLYQAGWERPAVND